MSQGVIINITNFKSLALLLTIISSLGCKTVQSQKDDIINYISLSSPSKNITVVISASPQNCGYKIIYKNRPLIEWSRIGVITDKRTLPNSSQFIESQLYSVDDS